VIDPENNKKIIHEGRFDLNDAYELKSSLSV
jgi:hypothetical protein